MAVLGTCLITNVTGINASGGLVQLKVKVGFGNAPGNNTLEPGDPVEINNIDPNIQALQIKALVEARVKEVMQAEPLNFVFGPLDTVRLLNTIME